jgi:hypothetical protein
MAVMPERVVEALRRGDTIEAIKRLRAVSPLGLKEAKDMIDAYRRGEIPLPARPTSLTPHAVHASTMPAGPPRHDLAAEARARSDKGANERMRLAAGFGLAQAKDASDASRYRDHPTGIGGRSPGEVPNSGRLVWWLVVIAMAAYAGWSALGRGGVAV